jgi:hypothetical protein
MRISFDLDDTLICYQPGVAQEPRLPWHLRWLVHDEPLRRGARALMRHLHAVGWELWVYTTSYRSPLTVRLWLYLHGVRVARVINQDIHERHFRRSSSRERIPSKNPAAFGIALHVDDSDGVRMEGDRFGFSVVVLSPMDADWADKVLAATERLRPSRA